MPKSLGIDGLIEKNPYELSGGQKQRTAIARAMITKPKLILADEPTGALDSKSTGSVLDIFDELNKEGQTIVAVTHSTEAASRAGRVLFIKDGVLFHQIYKEEKTFEKMYEEISNTLTSLMKGGDGK